MTKERDAMELRQDIDDLIERKWRRARKSDRPHGGWIRAIRHALEMSTHQFARLLNVSQSSVRRIEQSEMNDTILLSTLRRAADVLNCRLVYALIPHEPLEKIVRDRREKIAFDDLVDIADASNLSRDEFHALMAAYARKIKAPRLWG